MCVVLMSVSREILRAVMLGNALPFPDPFTWPSVVHDVVQRPSLHDRNQSEVFAVVAALCQTHLQFIVNDDGNGTHAIHRPWRL
jgi:hypothetical protein